MGSDFDTSSEVWCLMSAKMNHFSSTQILFLNKYAERNVIDSQMLADVTNLYLVKIRSHISRDKLFARIWRKRRTNM